VCGVGVWCVCVYVCVWCVCAGVSVCVCVCGCECRCVVWVCGCVCVYVCMCVVCVCVCVCGYSLIWLSDCAVGCFHYVHHIGKRNITTFVCRNRARDETMIRIPAKDFVVSAQCLSPAVDLNCVQSQPVGNEL